MAKTKGNDTVVCSAVEDDGIDNELITGMIEDLSDDEHWVGGDEALEGLDKDDDELYEVPHGCLTNEEIFTDEYIGNYVAKMKAHNEREKRTDRLVSVGVIVGCLLFIGVLILICYRDFIFN